MNYRNSAIAWLALLHATFSRQEQSLAHHFAEFPQADVQPARRFAELLFTLSAESEDAELIKTFSADAIQNYREANVAEVPLLELIAKAVWARSKGTHPEMAVELARQTLPLADQPSDGEFSNLILRNEEEIVEEARQQTALLARLDEYITANQAQGG